MIIGIETSSLEYKSTGTNRYLNCLLEQINTTSHQIVKFSSTNHFDRNNYTSKAKKIWYRNFQLRQEINNSDAACVIFPDYYMPRGITKKSAIVIHDLSFISHPQFYSKYFTAYYKYQIKSTLRQNPIIVTVSEHSKQNIAKYLNVNEKDILLVQGYSEMNLPVNSRLKNISSENPFLLYVGHIEPRKNLDFMIEGFLRWKEKTGSELKLKIIGELWIKTKSTMELINEYGNHPDVEFKGYVTENELAEYYSNASGFIHTSLEEGFGFPVLEAMNYNLPILCSENIGTSEISGKYSVKIDPTNFESFYKGLERLSKIISKTCSIEYEINYSQERTHCQLEILLEKLLEGNAQKTSVNIPFARNNEQALEKTLLYASLFNCGINETNLHQQVFDLKMNELELKNSIIKLQLNGNVKSINNYLFIDWNEKEFYSKNVLKLNKNKAERLLQFLTKLPFVSMIAFSGGTAHYGISNHDDIDLFIITKQNTVYIVYLIIHLFSIIFRTRKELCANYLIDESELKIKYAFDLYTAHQIITLIPFKNPQMLSLFLNENEWVKKFFPNFTTYKNGFKSTSSKNIYLKPMNLILMLLYRFKYRKKIKSSCKNGSLILKQNCLKLHTNDHRIKVLTEFQKRIYEYYKMKNFDNNVKQNHDLVEAGS